MIIPKTKTKNFNLHEIIHRVDTFDLNNIGIAYIAMGYMQRLRDELSTHFGKDVGLKITSGYRELEYNRSLKSSDTSYHIWRYQDGQAIWAIDFEPIGVSTYDVYEYLAKKKPFNGELYYHSKHNFIHIAPNGIVSKNPWIV
jgi:uncharacterized protein YcbK (DUF882 family)